MPYVAEQWAAQRLLELLDTIDESNYENPILEIQASSEETISSEKSCELDEKKKEQDKFAPETR